MVFYIAKQAECELDEMPASLKLSFMQHMWKLQDMLPGRHLKHGVPYYVENVTRQARLVYQLHGDDVHIIRCFSLHKDYERWYQSYK
jgi:hypothetical protein